MQQISNQSPKFVASFLFKNWRKSGLAIVAGGSEPDSVSTWFIDLTFARGVDNYIRWRASDLAGNGYHVSDDYQVIVNVLPQIVIKGVGPNGVYPTLTILELNAEDTTDPDSKLQEKNFIWHSNITGSLGTGRIINTQLSSGRHLISLTVFDGQNYAVEKFNITIVPPQKVKKEEDSGMFGISQEAHSIIGLLIVIIIIVVLVFLFIYSREKRMRRRLEEKAFGAGIDFPSSYHPAMAGARDMPQISGGLRGSGAPVVLGKGGAPSNIVALSSSKTVAGPSGQPKLQQLPAVGGVTPTVMEAAGTGVSTVGRGLPQLPPARIRGYPMPKPDLKTNIDIKKKIELLEKKMLLGEIPVELYTKLSKKYEDEIKSGPENPKLDKKNDDPKTPQPKAGITPDKIGKPEQDKPYVSHDKTITPQPPPQPMVDEPKIHEPEIVPAPQKHPETQAPNMGLKPKIKKKKKRNIDGDQKSGFESAPGFSAEELEFLKKLKKDKEEK
jgi:hypothetical protein